MTSARLAQLIGKHKLFGDRRITIEPERVYYAGTTAQQGILSELKILEQHGRLALIAGQERYQFSAIAVTALSDATPVVATAAGHVLNTGDQIALAGANATLNRRWIVTKVDADTFSLDDSTAQGTGLTATAYHSLFAACDIKFIRKLSPNAGRLDPITPEQAEDDRERYGDDDQSTVDEVNKYYVVIDEPLIVGVRGIPSEAILTEVLYYRRALPSEALSASINPIIPAQYDELLRRGTLYHLLDQMDEPGLEEMTENAFLKYEKEKARVANIVGMSRLVKPSGTGHLKW